MRPRNSSTALGSPKPLSTMLAPRPASASAMPRPMPLVDPVTTAVLPDSIGFSLACCCNANNQHKPSDSCVKDFRRWRAAVQRARHRRVMEADTICRHPCDQGVEDIMDAKTVNEPVAAHGWRPQRCDRVALVLQGGGALGAYQAGVYQ